jgi:hypothetical protein
MFSGKALQARWKNLRDRYAKYVKSMKSVKSGSGGKRKLHIHIYTKQMAFLKDVLEYNRTTSSLDCNNKEQIEEAKINLPMMTEAATLSQPGQSTSSKEKSFERKRRLDPVESEIITPLEANRAAKRMEENKSDDDGLHLLLSLLPTMKNVPEHLKLATRMELMQVLVKNTSLHASTHP